MGMNPTESLLSLSPGERLELLTALSAGEPIAGRVIVAVQRIVRRPARRTAPVSSTEVAA